MRVGRGTRLGGSACCVSRGDDRCPCSLGCQAFKLLDFCMSVSQHLLVVIGWCVRSKERRGGGAEGRTKRREARERRAVCVGWAEDVVQVRRLLLKLLRLPLLHLVDLHRLRTRSREITRDRMGSDGIG